MVNNPFLPNIHVLKLSSYTSPPIVENARRKWVEYGKDNNFFGYLIDLYHSSPTNNAAISGISDLIYGAGLKAEKGAKLNAYLEFVQLFRPEEVRRVVHDLKLFGQAAFQLALESEEITGAFHIPMDKLRPEVANEDGEIENWFYSDDWSQCDKAKYKPRPIAALREGLKAKEAVYVIQTYSPGSFYFSPVDYQGGLQYAELEGEIANYHLNNIKNGLAPGMLINFNNGIPQNEVQYDIEQAVNLKFGGSSNAGRAIVAFNDSKDTAADITPVPLSDAPQQYQFLSDECMRKIMVAHRITSPLLLGIKDNTGLGNNAEELEKASILFTNTVIRPFQRLVLEAIESILAHNSVSLPLRFVDLNPFKMDAGGDIVQTEDSKEAVAMSSDKPEFTVEDEAAWIAYLENKGEVMEEDLWELISEDAVEDPEGEAYFAHAHVKLFKRFAEPDKKSEDDSGIYRVRYRYSPLQTQANSRDFCIRMVANGKQGVVYRREDIDKMDGVVNTQFAPKGSSTYSIWRYKGGVNCHHAWFRLVYKRKLKNGKVIPLTEKEKAEGSGWRDLENNYNRKSTASARAAGVPKSKLDPVGIETAETRPIDMPQKGRKN